jgi:glycosyltransferase involved in cell wall biosynthesis
MRIQHVTDSYLPTLGGIELHIRDLVGRQRAAGHEVTVATRGAPAPVGLADPDVVHAHVSIVSPFALATARRSALRGVPTVVTVHSLWTHVGPLPELARELWGMRRWDVTWTAVSEPAAQPVRELLRCPVHLVPNAVDLAEWRPPAETPVVDPPRVLSVMRLTGVKRAMPLVRTLRRVARHHDFSATIVGDGPERPTMRRYLRRHGLADRVRLTGALDRSEIRALLQDASVFLAPAHRESFGIAALEARASGVPVVASSRSGVATFIEHGRSGLLGADDSALGDHLQTLLSDCELREQLTRHNRRVAPAYGWEQALVRNEDVYLLATAARAHRPVAHRSSAGVLAG